MALESTPTFPWASSTFLRWWDIKDSFGVD